MALDCSLLQRSSSFHFTASFAEGGPVPTIFFIVPSMVDRKRGRGSVESERKKPRYEIVDIEEEEQKKEVIPRWKQVFIVGCGPAELRDLYAANWTFDNLERELDSGVLAVPKAAKKQPQLGVYLFAQCEGLFLSCPHLLCHVVFVALSSRLLTPTAVRCGVVRLV